MQFSQHPENYKEAAQNGYRIRGYFINEIIVVERLMDRFIAKHFSTDPDKQMELIELFISTKRISFEGKRQAFKSLVDKHYKSKFESRELIYTNLKKIEDFRNMLAHNILDTSQRGIENIKNGIIGFLLFESKTLLQTYTNDDIEKFKTIISELQTELYKAVE